MIRFLLNLLSPPKNEHEFKFTVQVDVFYPNHPPRTETSLFRKSRKHLIDELKTPCFICGTHDNLELHHFYIEDSYAEAVDWDIMRKLHPDFDWSTFKDPYDFVDHEYNMKVLCMDHHRGKTHGIHYLPYPLWIIQRYKKNDFQLFPEQKNQLTNIDESLAQYEGELK